jgi:hypothetical protein
VAAVPKVPPHKLKKKSTYKTYLLLYFVINWAFFGKMMASSFYGYIIYMERMMESLIKIILKCRKLSDRGAVCLFRAISCRFAVNENSA